MFRYTLVSVISTAVYLAVLILVFGFLHLWSEVPSVLFASAVATVPSYFLNRKWAWGKSGRSHLLKEVIPFWATSIVGLLVATLTAALAHSFSTLHHLKHFDRTVVVVGATFAAAGLLWIGKFLIFDRLFRHTLGEIEVDLVGH